MTTAEDFFAGRTVLVTGGTGSIGSELVDALLRHDLRALRILSRDDTKQFELQHRLGEDARLRFLIGDVRSADRMRRAMAGVDFVFHAAALKHVGACEFNPFEATETNVRGTQNVVEAATDAGVGRVLTISTDKAVDPTNVMGATKLLSERLMAAAQTAKGPAHTKFAAVRFGNVIGSRGSLIPLVRTQVQRGGPVTVTDPDMTRYLMPVRDAVDLCLEAMVAMNGGEVFILKMPRVRVGDLVDVLVDEFARHYGHGRDQIEIRVIGARRGEKRHEILMTAEEAETAVQMGNMFVVSGGGHSSGVVTSGRANEAVLSHDEIRHLLDQAGWLEGASATEP